MILKNIFSRFKIKRIKNKDNKYDSSSLEKKIMYSIEHNTMEYVVAKQYEKNMYEQNKNVMMQHNVFTMNNMYMNYAYGQQQVYTQSMNIQPYSNYQASFYNRQMDYRDFRNNSNAYYQICPNCYATTTNMFCERCNQKIY